MFSIPFYSSHETVIKYDLDKLDFYLYNVTNAGLEKTLTVDNTVRNNSTTTILPDSMGTSVKMFSDWIVNEPDPFTNTRTLNFHHALYQWTPQKSVAGGYADLKSSETLYQGTIYETERVYGEGFGPYTTEEKANGEFSLISRYVLNNLNTPAFSRYKATITIVHKDKIGEPDEDQYTEKFVIWQYPAMYIESDPNAFITNNNQPYGAAVYGNVYINNSQSGNGNMDPSGLTGNNRNPNMYIVTITQLSDKRYIVGDPRQTTSNTLDYDWVTAPALDQTTARQLKYYYPTDASDSKKFYIAPKLRIASSYGVSDTMNKTTAQQRCAGYQELNCPAGRWRLPTYGELEYIINLSNKGKIPVLFSDNSRYWTAQGSTMGKVSDEGYLGNSGTTNAHVRCVYDEWYWGDSKVPQDGTKTWTYRQTNYIYNYYPFTWGDSEMKNN